MIINDYIVNTGGILFDVWCIMNFFKKAYTFYNTYTQADEYIDIINKYNESSQNKSLFSLETTKTTTTNDTSIL